MLDGKTELGLQCQFLLISLGHLGVMADGFHLGFQLGGVVVNLAGVEDYLAHVYRHDGYSACLKQLLAVTACVEPERTSTDLADARMGQLTHNAANSGELVDILHQQVAVYRISMVSGVSERYAALIEVVAHGYLTAESVATAVKVNFVVLVVTGLYQYRHVQLGAAYGVDDAYLEAEIRQRHDDSVNLVAVGAEELCALLSVFNRFHRTSRGSILLIKYHIAISGLVKFLKKSLAHVYGKF